MWVPIRKLFAPPGVPSLLRACRYAIKPTSRIIRSQPSQLATAGKEADMRELQAHHCVTPGNDLAMCSVSVISTNKLPLQELNQLIGIKMVT